MGTMVGLGLALVGCFVDEPSATTSGAGTSAATSDATTTSAITSSTTTGVDESTSSGSTTQDSTSTTGETTDTTTGGFPSTCPESPSLLLCYSFEGDVSTVVVDSSANNYPGIAFGVDKAPGHPGEGVVLGPESLIRVPDDDMIFTSLADAFTISAWIIPELAALPAEAGVVARPGHFGMTLRRDQDQVSVACYHIASVATTGPLGFRGWTHAACRYDGLTITVILDGLVVNSTEVADTGVNPHDLFIGNIGPEPSAADAYVGVIDEVQVWSVALSDAELCAYSGLVSCG